MKVAGPMTLLLKSNRWRIGFALALLAADIGICNFIFFSIQFCPFWIIGECLKSAMDRPGWRVALIKISIPTVTMGLVLGNGIVQYRISEANAAKIISACQEFFIVNGGFPNALEELVPRFLPSIPRASYSYYGDFVYDAWNREHRDRNPKMDRAYLSWTAGLRRTVYFGPRDSEQPN